VEKHARTKVQKRRLVDADNPREINSRNSHDNAVKVYRPDVTKKRENARPANYRKAEPPKTTTRTEPATRRTTEKTSVRYSEPRFAPRNTNQTTQTYKKRNSEPRVAPRTSNHSSREKSNSKANVRQVDKKRPNHTPYSRNVKTKSQAKPKANVSTRMKEQQKTQVKPKTRTSTRSRE